MLSYTVIDEHDDDEEGFLDKEEYNFFEYERKAVLSTQEKEYLKESFDVKPLGEVIEGDDDLTLKINAIDKLSKISTFEAISILKDALAQKDYEVRYFANNALLKLEQIYYSKIEEFDILIQDSPDNSDHYRSRADRYLEMGQLGLLDDSVKGIYLEKALVDYMTSLSLNASQAFLYVRIIEVNIHLKRFSEISPLYELAIGTDIDKSNVNKLHSYMGEAYYELGDYQRAKDVCNLIDLEYVSFDKIEDVVHWWANVS